MVRVAPTPPSDQFTVPVQPAAVRLTLPPAQIPAVLAEIVGAVGAGSSVKARLFDGPEVPQASEQVAVSVPAAFTTYVRVAPLPPSDQFTVPVQPAAVRFTVVPAQTLV